jgi:hypothetical protein
MMSIFAMSIVTARRSSIMASRVLRLFFFCRPTIEVAGRTFSIGSTSIVRSPVTRSPMLVIFAFVSGVALARRRLAHPGRQHFKID